MKLIKVIYDSASAKQAFVLIDGAEHAICPGLSILASEVGGVYTITAYTSGKNRTKQPGFEAAREAQAHTINDGESKSGVYTTTEWSYLKGVESVSRSYTISVVDINEALSSPSTSQTLKARLYLFVGDYKKADELLLPLLDFNWYLYINKEAHALMAYGYEEGLGLEKNLDLAFRHYLLAEAREDIIRFLDMGYAKGAFKEDYHAFSWDIYHTLLVLDFMGERDFAYKQMIVRAANDWCYTWEEKESTDRELVANRYNSAMARKQAAEWIIERRDKTEARGEHLVLFLGAYYAYLKTGSEDRCTYYDDDGGVGQTSAYRALDYVTEAQQKGEELAIKGLALIAEAKMEDKT